MLYQGITQNNVSNKQLWQNLGSNFHVTFVKEY